MAAVAVGRRTDALHERSPHRFGGAESGAGGDGRDRVVRFLERPPRRLEADLGDVLARRHPDLLDESALEVPLAHRDAAGQPPDPVIVAWLPIDERLGLTDGIVIGALDPHRGGELRLVRGPVQEHHQPASDGLGDVDANVLSYQCEREVDPRGDSCG